MKKRGVGMLGIAMAIALLFSCVSVPAGTEEANNGWLSITVGDDRNEFNPEGIRLAIYLIATGDYGDWTMVDSFSDITVFIRSDGSASVDKTLSQIRQRIADRKIKPAAEAVCDAKGKIEFKDLAHGIYYTEMTAGPERLTMSAMLLSVPNSSGSVQVRANAKYEYETPTPSPTPTPKPTFTPFVPPEVTDTPAPNPTDTPYVPPEETDTPAPTAAPETSGTPTAPPEESATPTVSPRPTPTPTTGGQGTAKHTATPAPVKVTRVPVPTPAPDTDHTPVPKYVPRLTPHPGETAIIIEDYEAALGLGNIQIHVGVCYE